MGYKYRIAYVDLPRDKRVEIALTYIYGIGRSTKRDIRNGKCKPEIYVKDLTEIG